MNQPLTEKELEAVRNCVRRNRPFGSDAWTAATAARAGLGYTLRPRGRPKKEHTH